MLTWFLKLFELMADGCKVEKAFKNQVNKK
jgi:hypothetical protein